MGAYYHAARSSAKAVLSVLSGWEVRGAERVPRTGGLIVAANHISFWDPPMVGSALPRGTYFLAKEELFATPILGPLIRSVRALPIRRGTADLSGMARAIEVLCRGEALLMFPEGSRMRDGELHPARPGIGMMAVNGDVPIAACYISGSNRWKQWWNRKARVRITFGAAMSWRSLAGDGEATGRALYQKVGDGVMREIAALRAEQESSASRGAA